MKQNDKTGQKLSRRHMLQGMAAAMITASGAGLLSQAAARGASKPSPTGTDESLIGLVNPLQGTDSNWDSHGAARFP